MLSRAEGHHIRWATERRSHMYNMMAVCFYLYLSSLKKRPACCNYKELFHDKK